jgi:hypothetical protein
VHTINQYRQEIEHLQEYLIPTTPLGVKDQRKEEAKTQIEDME